jgi:hypothetical protein
VDKSLRWLGGSIPKGVDLPGIYHQKMLDRPELEDEAQRNRGSAWKKDEA